MRCLMEKIPCSVRAEFEFETDNTRSTAMLAFDMTRYPSSGLAYLADSLFKNHFKCMISFSYRVSCLLFFFTIFDLDRSVNKSGWWLRRRRRRGVRAQANASARLLSTILLNNSIQ